MSNAHGSLGFPALRKAPLGGGVQTELATLIGPGARVAAYVRSTGVQSGDDPEIALRLLPGINQALSQCRPGMGDVVVVLPGHAEDIGAADALSNLVAGTRIVGLGHGTMKPTLTWTAAGSTLLLDVADVVLSGFRLNLAGDPESTDALTVGAPITVSGDGCAIVDCDIQVGVDGNQLATVPIAVTGDDCAIANCFVFGDSASGVTTCVRLTGADRFKLLSSYIIASTSAAAVGVVQLSSTASVHVLLSECTLVNTKSDSSAAVAAMSGCSGALVNCGIGFYTGSGLAAVNTPGNLQAFHCQTVNTAGEAGAPSETVSEAGA